MMKRTIRQYDIKHSGDEMDRIEILAALRALWSLIQNDRAEVSIESVKSDLIMVTIEEIDMP
jgi:hypothetical protein